MVNINPSPNIIQSHINFQRRSGDFVTRCGGPGDKLHIQDE